MLDETAIKTGAFKVVKRTIGRQSTLGMAEFPGAFETELKVAAKKVAGEDDDAQVEGRAVKKMEFWGLPIGDGFWDLRRSPTQGFF